MTQITIDDIDHITLTKVLHSTKHKQLCCSMRVLDSHKTYTVINRYGETVMVTFNPDEAIRKYNEIVEVW